MFLNEIRRLAFKKCRSLIFALLLFVCDCYHDNVSAVGDDPAGSLEQVPVLRNSVWNAFSSLRYEYKILIYVGPYGL